MKYFTISVVLGGQGVRVRVSQQSVVDSVPRVFCNGFLSSRERENKKHFIHGSEASHWGVGSICFKLGMPLTH